MAGYHDNARNQWVDTEDVTLATSVARTANGDSGAVGISQGTARLTLDVTTVGGTGPTLDVVIETSFDGASNWRSLGAFAQRTGVGAERKSFPGCDRFIRARWTLGGTTPSFTFSVTGEAV
jgi:hypothetical protein